MGTKGKNKQQTNWGGLWALIGCWSSASPVHRVKHSRFCTAVTMASTTKVQKWLRPTRRYLCGAPGQHSKPPLVWMREDDPTQGRINLRNQNDFFKKREITEGSLLKNLRPNVSQTFFSVQFELARSLRVTRARHHCRARLSWKGTSRRRLRSIAQITTQQTLIKTKESSERWRFLRLSIPN